MHLLSIESLSDDADRRDPRRRRSGGSIINRSARRNDHRLDGLTILNAFFENSTRTLLSFEIAANRLGAQVVTMQVERSSIKKGETLEDTARTLNAMRPDAIVIRHGRSGAPARCRGAGRLPGDQRRRRDRRASDPGAARRRHAASGTSAGSTG